MQWKPCNRWRESIGKGKLVKLRQQEQQHEREKGRKCGMNDWCSREMNQQEWEKELRRKEEEVTEGEDQTISPLRGKKHACCTTNRVNTGSWAKHWPGMRGSAAGLFTSSKTRWSSMTIHQQQLFFATPASHLISFIIFFILIEKRMQLTSNASYCGTFFPDQNFFKGEWAFHVLLFIFVLVSRRYGYSFRDRWPDFSK